jgi:hypothetical protein
MVVAKRDDHGDDQERPENEHARTAADVCCAVPAGAKGFRDSGDGQETAEDEAERRSDRVGEPSENDRGSGFFDS